MSDQARQLQQIKALRRQGAEKRRLDSIRASLLRSISNPLPNPQDMSHHDLVAEFENYYAISNTPFMTRELRPRWLCVNAEHNRRLMAELFEA